MHAQLDSGSNMDWVPIGQLLSLVVKAKIAKNGTSDITLRPRELDLLTI